MHREIIILTLPKASKNNKKAFCLHKTREMQSKKLLTFFFIHVDHKNDKSVIKQLKLIAKNRGLKNYKNKSEDDLIKILSEPNQKQK